VTVSYNVVLKRSAEKDLRNLPKAELRKVVEKISSLAKVPRPSGCVKLSGQEHYRLRQGDWRVIYGVDDTDRLVTVIKIGHRKEIYSSI
jgi:mRNA interferase RelE/StbE